MWVLLALLSALLLGVYDVFKKVSLRDNAVIPVLSTSIFISALFLLLASSVTWICPEQAKSLHIYLPNIDWQTHFFIFLKALIVLGSWISAYFGMKNIPITIFSPIRATQPLWTVLGAFFIFSERLTLLQFVGVAMTLISFYLFSLVGLKEGISWKSNRWIWLIILATLLGSVSGLYDKHLMHQYDRIAVQVYSTFYQALMMLLVLFLLWYPRRMHTTKFQWRWSIVGISVFLIIADYVYFWAISEEGAMISIISTIRRSGAVVPFMYGMFLLHERNLKIKSLLFTGVLIGVFLLYLGS